MIGPNVMIYANTSKLFTLVSSFITYRHIYIYNIDVQHPKLGIPTSQFSTHDINFFVFYMLCRQTFHFAKWRGRSFGWGPPIGTKWQFVFCNFTPSWHAFNISPANKFLVRHYYHTHSNLVQELQKLAKMFSHQKKTQKLKWGKFANPYLHSPLALKCHNCG